MRPWPSGEGIWSTPRISGVRVSQYLYIWNYSLGVKLLVVCEKSGVQIPIPPGIADFCGPALIFDKGKLR